MLRNSIAAKFGFLSSASHEGIKQKEMKIGPVVSAENRLIEIALRVHLVVRRISSNITGCTGPIFTIFSPYESVYMPMMEQYFIFPLICQGTLPWQPIKVQKSANLLCATAILHQLIVLNLGSLD